VTAGVVRGTGKQKIGAIGFLVGYYFIGLPTGISLMFAAHMGIIGKERSKTEATRPVIIYFLADAFIQRNTKCKNTVQFKA
ncbi:S47A1 protein, partial [Amia calva]|nr:S47A1 protein [Amia calva]